MLLNCWGLSMSVFTLYMFWEWRQSHFSEQRCYYVGWENPTSKFWFVFSSGTENVFPWDVLPLLATWFNDLIGFDYFLAYFFFGTFLKVYARLRAVFAGSVFWECCSICVVVCGYQMKNYPRSYDRNFCNCVKKPKKKKMQDFNGAWTRDLAIPVRRSTNWAMKPLTVGRRSILGSYVPVKDM